MNTLKYKGYVGSIEFSEEDNLFFGKVLGIRSLLSYEGENATELVNDFHEAVDGYLNMCEEEGIEPERAFKGSFNVRIKPELHREIAIQAEQNHTSLNQYVVELLRRSLSEYYRGGYNSNVKSDKQNDCHCPELLHYNYCNGTLKWSEDKHMFYGNVLGFSNDTEQLSYTGETREKCEENFKAVVNDFLNNLPGDCHYKSAK